MDHRDNGIFKVLPECRYAVLSQQQLLLTYHILLPGIWWVHRARHRYIKEGSSVLEDKVVVIDVKAVSATEVIREFLHERGKD